MRGYYCVIKLSRVNPDRGTLIGFGGVVLQVEMSSLRYSGDSGSEIFDRL